MRRVKLLFLLASFASLTIVAAVAGAIAPDPRLAQCGDGAFGNTAKASFTIPEVSRIWNHLPAMGLAPELATDSGPAFVVLFDKYTGLAATGVFTASDVVCVVDKDGRMVVYVDVAQDGLSIP